MLLKFCLLKYQPYLVILRSPVAFGKVIVLSAVGSVTVNVVSKSSAVAPSNTIDVLIFKPVAVTELLNVAAPDSDTSKLNRSIVEPVNYLVF